MIFSPTNYATGATTDAALQQIREQVVPYSQYWWRRRPMASGYSEARIRSINDGYSSHTEVHTSSSDDITYYYLSVYEWYSPNDSEESQDIYATLQYSSSITINQSTGAITMNNPLTYIVTEKDEGNITSSSFYSRFQGKYVKGFIGCSDILFYIPTNVRMYYKSWQLGNENANASYYGYEFTKDSGDSQPFRVSVQQNSSIGTWETISSSDSSAYPKSGTSSGYQWVYMGQVVDATIKNVPTWTKINITSANFTGTTAFVEIPASIAIVMVGGSAGTFAVIDTVNSKAYGIKATNSNYNPTTGINGVSGISDGIAVADGGIKLTSSSGGFSATISYLPLA